ncbi:MAG: hypothetical protein ACR2PK_09910 [Acidimicrobiales bacterium]
MTDHPVRNAQAEASAVAGRPALVLEPSPPAVPDEPWFADDPADATGHGEAIVGPTTAASPTWSQLSAESATIAEFARDHWLGNFKTLPPVPPDYVSSRNDFHRVAYGVLSNTRKAANGKIGLRYTRRGFGTPFFGDDEQIRVEGNQLVVQRGGSAISEQLTTLARAASVAGTVASPEQAEHDTVELGDTERVLDVREDVGLFLGDWFGFATAVLEQTRLIAAVEDDVTRVQIWPGHFDPAIEMGSAEAGQRATYGASPGDQSHPEPYLYVAAWDDLDTSHMHWNSEHFSGALLSYEKLCSRTDQHELALDFFRVGYELLRQ